jgi:hypothetical protein
MSEEEQYDYDLDALVVDAESAPPFRFKWRGEVWEMPLMNAMPFQDQMDLEEATVEQSMGLIMGEEQFARFMLAGTPAKPPISTGRMRELIDQWHKFQGLTPGESRASRRSSGNTARPSKRTSRSGR